jgi:tetratricopeptide (TPR) repeat protein
VTNVNVAGMAVVPPRPVPMPMPVYRPNQPWGGWIRPYYGGVHCSYGWVNSGSGFVWGNYYASRYYTGWHGGYWNGYFFYSSGFVPRPVPLGWILAPGASWVYQNPYWNSQPTVVNEYINYSRPIVADAVTEAPTETVASAVDTRVDTSAKQASDLLDLAREQFQQKQYATAKVIVEKAIAILPKDPTLHEFRALTLFATGDYAGASATIYAVLAAGPGWNGETMVALYDKPETYVEQLTALETFANKNEKSAEAQFLLGYHYLVIGEKENAIKALNTAVRLQPNDRLSAELLKKLSE